jgi:hypothetical protein
LREQIELASKLSKDTLDSMLDQHALLLLQKTTNILPKSQLKEDICKTAQELKVQCKDKCHCLESEPAFMEI